MSKIEYKPIPLSTEARKAREQELHRSYYQQFELGQIVLAYFEIPKKAKILFDEKIDSSNTSTDYLERRVLDPENESFFSKHQSARYSIALISKENKDTPLKQIPVLHIISSVIKENDNSLHVNVCTHIGKTLPNSPTLDEKNDYKSTTFKKSVFIQIKKPKDFIRGIETIKEEVYLNIQEAVESYFKPPTDAPETRKLETV